jgi:hypothetical protein
MAQYKFKEDFYNTETSKVGSTDRTPIFKVGDIIDTEKVDNLRMNEEGIFYPFNDVNAQEIKVVFVPFTSLQKIVSKTNVAIIVFGILAVGFVSYKLIKKFA